MKTELLPPVADFYNKVLELLTKARSHVVQSMNQTMVYSYYEIGRVIVEEEQNGAKRVDYGQKILKELAKRLTTRFGKGFSMGNLERMRGFFKMYSLPISATPLRKLQSDARKGVKSKSALLKITQVVDFRLSWSHYLKLMRIENPAERRFYEIESINNNWSLRKLERQFDSALYERLALSIGPQSFNGCYLERSGSNAKGVSELSPGLPSVARLPWVSVPLPPTPNGVTSRRRRAFGNPGRNPVGVVNYSGNKPRVGTRSSYQPWAKIRNPFGVKSRFAPEVNATSTFQSRIPARFCTKSDVSCLSQPQHQRPRTHTNLGQRPRFHFQLLESKQ
jgi:hypothetical protein